MADRLFFKHDLYCLDDRKLKKVIKKYHGNGYAVFFVAVELLYKEQGEPIEKEDIVTDIADGLRIEESLVEEILEYIIEVGLLEDGDNCIRSERVTLTCDHAKVISAINSKNRKSKENESKTNRKGIDKESLTNFAKDKDKDKDKEYPPLISSPLKGGAFKKPTLEEVVAYCTERANGIDPQAFIAFYESNGWKVGKNPMKDWKAAIRTWESRRREENKPKQRSNMMVEDLEERMRLNASIDPRTGEPRRN